MPRVVIDNVVVTNYINISEISDSLSNSGNNFIIEILGYPVTNRLSAVRVEIYDDQGDLAAIGTGVPTVKVGLRPITIYNCVDYSKALNRKRINQQYSGLLRGILEQAIIDGNASMYFAGVTFFSDSTTPDIVINQNISYLLLKDALSSILLAAGKQLTYKIPIDDNRIYIYEPGFAPLAPIPVLNVDSLYTCASQGVKDISYSKIKPLASVIRVFGLNSKQLYNTETGIVREINPDILRYRAQDSRTQYPLSQTANELLLIKVTTPQPQPGGECNIAVVLSGSNYTTYDTYDQSDYSLPTDLVEDEMTLEFSASEATLIYTATVLGVKENSSISFYLNGSFNGVTANISITVDGLEIYSADPIDVQSITQVISLFDYLNQNIEVVATVTIPAQSGTCIDYYGLICPTTEIQQLWLDAHCCNINTIVGNGTGTFNGDNQEPLDTSVFSVSCLGKLSTGELIFADSLNYRVRKVTDINTVTTIGGNGGNSSTPVDGVATDQEFGEIEGLFVFNDEIYITLIAWGQIGKITTLGDYEIIETIVDAGNALTGIAVDSTGIIYVADLGRNLILKIDGGVLSTYAGIASDSTATGDGGLATSAAIGEPYALAVDSDDNLYFTDINNNLVRMITKSTGIISAVAGGGTSKTFNDLASDWELSFPTGLTIDNNNIYLFDSGLNYVFIIDNNGLINKYAGIGLSGFDGDLGSPLTAKLNGSFNFGGGLYVETLLTEDNTTETSLFLSDQANFRIRRISCIYDTPNFENAYCLLMSWTASGIFTEETTTATGFGFTVAGGDLGVSATGSYTTTVEIPNSTQHYILRFFPASILGGLTGGTRNGGQIKFYINAVLERTFDLSPTFAGTISEGTLSITDFLQIDLTQYAGQTIDIEFEYDGTNYDATGAGTGSIEFFPIRICTKPQNEVPSSQLTVLATNSTQSTTQNITLNNPETGQAEFFGYRLTLHGESLISNPSQEYDVNLYVDDTLVYTFSKPQVEGFYTFDENLAGTTIEIKLELTHSNGTGQEVRGITQYS